MTNIAKMTISLFSWSGKHWEKEKMLVTSIFFFSYRVFQSFFLRVIKKFGLCGKELIFPNKPWFLRVCSTRLLKTHWEKEKLLVMSNFSFYHSVFYQFGELSAIFIQFEIFVCKFFAVLKSLKYVIWGSVNEWMCRLDQRLRSHRLDK